MMQETKRDRGFFTIAQNSPTGDYVRMAYALALSLKATQPNIPWLSIGVPKGQKISEKYAYVFDEIIEIPWGDMAKEEKWKLNNEWKVPFMTPYKETIKLDADMLFLSNIEHWWEMTSRKSLVSICKQAITYRGEKANDQYYRQVFKENNYVNAYSALTYFSKEHESFMFYKACEHIFKNWQKFDWLLNDWHQESKATTDVVYAMAAILEEKESEYMAEEFFTFVHMKTMCQNLETNIIDESWIKNIPHHFTPELELFVGNFKQTLPFHYHDKAFLTDEIINFYEEKVND